MKPRVYVLATAVVFSLVAVLHLLRLAFGWSVVIAGWHVPFWLSWLALAVLAVFVLFALKVIRRLR